MTEIPMARGLFVCEQVIVDYHTRNASLINCFSEWPMESFPSQPQRFSVYSALTCGSGTWMLKVTISRLTDLTTIYERMIPYYFSSPQEVMRFHFRVRQCVFPSPADYLVQLSAGNEVVADSVIKISQSEHKT